MTINRRQAVMGATALAGLAATQTHAADRPAQAKKLPRWRGFNLMEKFTIAGNRPYEEWDFQFCRDNGFDYLRLPLDYRIWTDPDGNWQEHPLKEIDQAIDYGRKHNIHITLCLHRVPGFCVNPPKEKLDLWQDRQAQDQFADQWRRFAARYRGIAPEHLSFNLLNEAPDIAEDVYYNVIRIGVEAIRAEDPARLIIADGRGGGRKPTYNLAPLEIAQAGRGYEPFHLTHYCADWVDGSRNWPVPTWPLREDNREITAQTLWQEQIEPWFRLENMGVGILIGEWGAYNKTPHQVTLNWMQDSLANWRKAGWGWSLWNLRGAFGPIDSDRPDAEYTNISGRRIDKKMLKVLQAG